MTRTKCPKCGFANPAEQGACSRCSTPLPRVSIEDDGGGGVADGQSQGVLFRKGQLIANRYTVVDLIGRGGMGCIYRVRDNTLDEEVALKTLLPQFVRDKVVVERFYNEARIARQLSHSNIVRVHDIGFAGSVLYISMEYLRGKSLRALMDELPPGQRLPIRTTLKVMDELCSALEYAHNYTIHRDIKPENIMLSTEGKVKLMDFGISKLMAQTQLTAVSMVMGTPYYMSPEQLKDSRNVDARADIYSVGVVLYEMLTGNIPTGIIRPASESLSDVPATLDPIVAKCVEPDPRNRYASARELRETLRPIRELIESGTEPRAAKPGSQPREWRRRVLGLGAVALIVAGTVLANGWFEQRRSNAGGVPVPLAVGSEPDPTAGEVQALTALVKEARDLAAPVAEQDIVRKRIVDLGSQYWGQAESLWKAGDPEALDMGWRALQCFVGVVSVPRDMVFVPPGTVPSMDGDVWVDGFYMDRAEVNLKAFDEFRQVYGWHDLPRAVGSEEPPEETPIAMVSFPDALAFASASGKALPTTAQWTRATVTRDGQYPGNTPAETEGDAEVDDATYFGCANMAGGVSEWTRSVAPASPGEPPSGEVTGEIDAEQLLQTVLLVRGGYSDSPDWAERSMRARAVAEWLGFRCVRPIPRNVEAVEQLLKGTR